MNPFMLSGIAAPRRGRLAALLASLVLSALLLCASGLPADAANGNYHTRFLAEKVVRLWFQRKDGVQVYEMVHKMNYSKRLALWTSVLDHPYVQAVREGRKGDRERLLFWGLKKTFDDILCYD